MEEAYAQLYQEFLRLRSLCLRQAALLRQFSTAQQQQQGSTNGDLTHLTSMTQIDSDYPVYLSSPTKSPPVLSPAEPCGVQGPFSNSGNFSDLLEQDMSKLCMETAAQMKEAKSNSSVPHSVNSGMTLSQEASYNVVKNLNLDHNREDARISVSGYPTPWGNILAQTNMMMSEVTLQSNTCEFCEAVFPGDTTTRGEYLRHLYSHVT